MTTSRRQDPDTTTKPTARLEQIDGAPDFARVEIDPGDGVWTDIATLHSPCGGTHVHARMLDEVTTLYSCVDCAVAAVRAQKER
jgi:hypothetical protein